MKKNIQDTFFNFKDRIGDFIVEEILLKSPLGKGDYIYFFIEKKNLTTMDVITNLMRKFKLNRKRIGIAGLKDKRGITRQRISILKKDLEDKGGEKAMLDFLERDLKVLDISYDEKGLRLWKNKWNHFYIMLRNNKKVKIEDLKKVVFAFLDKIQEKWLPNYYGSQKMWVTWQNPKLGYLLISGKIKTLKYEKDSPLEKKFKIQAYASDIFNKYIDARIDQNLLDKPVKGDVVVWKPSGSSILLEDIDKFDKKNMLITGPVVGYDLMLPKYDSLKLEKRVLNKSKLDINNLENFKKFNLFGIRRPVVVNLRNMKYMFNKNEDLLLEFDLQAGSYASVLVDLLEERLKDRFSKTPKTKINKNKPKKAKKRRVDIDKERKNKWRRHFKKKKNI